MAWTQAWESAVASAQTQGLRRRLRTCSRPDAAHIEFEGRVLVQFAGNNYLGLATHPRVVAAAKSALDQYGSGTGASRLVGGGHLKVHARLEETLARFTGMPAALVYATGSMANMGLLDAVAASDAVVLLDKACHATLYDGARLSGAKVLRFPHQSLDRLENLLVSEGRGGRAIVVVEGVYSMDGDCAPLPALIELTARYEALLVVDEAHSSGVLGSTGRGLLEHYGLAAPPPHLVITGTLSKALASLGGYIAGPAALIDFLVNHSRAFIYATALPASCAAAALEALHVLRDEPEHLKRLWSNRGILAVGLKARGWNTGRSMSPIVPIIVGTPADTLLLERRLWEAGFYVPAMRPPTVPANACRLRLNVGAYHSPAQIQALLEALGSNP